ncbi:AraC family transcriptional regulator [Yeosuana sp. MJ-SS3]|uniref:AraC family transcriptional regulator n=1 Tax=Gilvirhabdus luticola TaxID=3079858 RepID=A0ABU3U3X8_9FLAO|nr:AraC family transcriptional regulator [Yeosuana sp. MJ-SS3]MDU8885027.1 AraC family transcriptional regulator [Yeosuana sp. MJ-SS3]
MYDFYAIMKSEIVLNKFEINDLLLVEYKCPLKEEKVKIWSQYDYLVYVLSGEKTWITQEGSWTVKKGEALYVKKGASIIKQNFDEEFCNLGFFVSDDLIRSGLKEVVKQTPIQNVEGADSFVINKVKINNQLRSFFQSVLGYFDNESKPLESILELKAKELLLNIINSNQNIEIASYLKNTTLNELPSLPNIMEANFSYNLNIDQFATLCNRSKSSFKRDFKNHYNCSPGKWILERRLSKAARLLQLDLDNVSQVAYDCGFESTAHFSRTFKKKYGIPPSSYKNSH